MSTNNRSQSLFLVSLMILASWVPLATADEGDSEQNSITNTGLSYTLDEFDPTNGKPYLFAGGEDEIIFSATRHLKQQWVDDGYPGLVSPFEERLPVQELQGEPVRMLGPLDKPELCRPPVAKFRFQQCM